MLQELLDVYRSDEFQEYGGASVVSAKLVDTGFYDWTDDILDLEIILRLTPGRDRDAVNRAHDREDWCLTCHSVIENRVALGGFHSFAVETEHAVLSRHTGPQRCLWLSRAGFEVAATIGALEMAHHRAVGHWIPFRQFFNPREELQQLLEGGYGLLASGPEGMLRTYQDVLDEFGFRTSTTINGHPYVTTKVSPVAVILGDSYIIAREVSATQLA